VQLALIPSPLSTSVQSFVFGVNDPLPTLAKLTTPVGALVGARSVSVTVTVHVVDVVACGDAGVHDSAVVVARLL
jgi:hypothetical protein